MSAVRILALAVLIPACFAQTAQVEVAASVAFTEGPTVDAQGNVYFTELRSQTIFRLPANSRMVETFREDSNGANGLVFDSEGRLLACEGGRNGSRITRTDMETGEVEVIADSFQGEPLNGPNDITVDGKGRIYFSDPKRRGPAAVYRLDPDGTLDRILVAPEIEQPNGLAISPDNDRLYLVESNQAEGGARMIRAYDLQPDGTVTNMRQHYNFYPGRSADGLSIDTEGNLYAAAGLHSRRGTSETLDTKPGIHVISPEGKLIEYIPIPEDTITNCAFGGPDMKTLYVTAGKTLFRVRTKVAGMRR